MGWFLMEEGIELRDGPKCDSGDDVGTKVKGDVRGGVIIQSNILKNNIQWHNIAG